MITKNRKVPYIENVSYIATGDYTKTLSWNFYSNVALVFNIVWNKSDQFISGSYVPYEWQLSNTLNHNQRIVLVNKTRRYGTDIKHGPYINAINTHLLFPNKKYLCMRFDAPGNGTGSKDSTYVTITYFDSNLNQLGWGLETNF